MILQIIESPKSSNIARFGHDPVDDVLYVQFKRTLKCYAYLDVPVDAFNQLRTADSVGSYFVANIQKAFVCQPLTEGQAQALGFETNVTV